MGDLPPEVAAVAARLARVYIVNPAAVRIFGTVVDGMLKRHLGNPEEEA